MTAAIASNEPEMFGMWDKVRRNYSDQKVKNLLAQAKLGIDSDDLIGKAEIERIFTAFAGRAAISIARMRDATATKLVGMQDAAAAGRVIYNALWRAGYVKPFVHAREQATLFGLPGWVVDALTKGFTDLMDSVDVPDSKTLDAEK